LDIDKVLITCNIDNIGSAKVIENNGWVFEKVNTRWKKKYRINL
jgi:predicted acetyltransferase